MEDRFIQDVVSGLMALASRTGDLPPVPCFPEKSPMEMLENSDNIGQLHAEMLQLLTQYPSIFTDGLVYAGPEPESWILVPSNPERVSRPFPFLHTAMRFEKRSDSKNSFNSQNSVSLRLLRIMGRKPKINMNSDSVFV